MSTIRYTGAADSWLECLPLGDGRLGAMTDGGVRATTIHLNDATAWSGSPSSESSGGIVDAGSSAALLGEARAAIVERDPIAAEAPLRALQTRYAQSFVPLGDLTIAIEPVGAVDADGTDDTTVRELNLVSGVHVSTAQGTTATTFISAKDSVLVHVIAPALPVRLEWRSPLHGPGSDTPVRLAVDDATTALLLRLPSDVAPGHEPDLPGTQWSTQLGAALEAAIAARIVQEDDRTVVLVATATTFTGVGRVPSGNAEDALDNALARIDSVSAVSADTLLSDASAHKRTRLGGVQLSFDSPVTETDTAIRFAAARAPSTGVLANDPGLAALLFEYGRYLLVSSSHPDGLPANLQGIWNAELRPPWGSAYTVNINTQMNYWGAHVTGLSEHARSLTAFTRALAKAAKPHTARLYDAPGWTVHHNTDAWLYATSPGRGHGDPRWAFWPMGGSWLASLLTEAWEFGSADLEQVQMVWPALRGAAEFALAWHRSGTTSPATSPENAFLLPDGRVASLATTSTMDLALIRMLLGKTLRVAEALGIEDDDVVREAHVRHAQLPDMPQVTNDATLVEWDGPRTDEDPHHRHVSHLFGLFPGSEKWDDARLKAAARTLERRGDDSSGWSLVWKLALWSRLLRPDKVADLLELFLRDAGGVSGSWAGGLYPNLFASHPPFQIDANLGYVGALAEAMLQSHDGIHLLPAIPDALGTGRVTGLIARPGIIVGMEWHDGSLTTATLRARHPGAAGAHRVRWREHTITADISADFDTHLDARSFFTEEVHP